MVLSWASRGGGAVRGRTGMVVTVAFATVWACEAGGPERERAASSALEPSAIGSPGHSTGGPFVDPVYGIAFETVPGFDVRVAFENPGAAAGVIRRRLLVEGSGPGHVVVDIWENVQRLSFDDWLQRYGFVARYRSGPVGHLRRWGAGGYLGVREQVSSRMSPPKDYAIVWTGDAVVRIMLVGGDRGASRAAFERILDTLRAREGTP